VIAGIAIEYITNCHQIGDVYAEGVEECLDFNFPCHDFSFGKVIGRNITANNDPKERLDAEIFDCYFERIDLDGSDTKDNNIQIKVASDATGTKGNSRLTEKNLENALLSLDDITIDELVINAPVGQQVILLRDEPLTGASAENFTVNEIKCPEPVGAKLVHHELSNDPDKVDGLHLEGIFRHSSTGTGPWLDIPVANASNTKRAHIDLKYENTQTGGPDVGMELKLEDSFLRLSILQADVNNHHVNLEVARRSHIEIIATPQNDDTYLSVADYQYNEAYFETGTPNNNEVDLRDRPNTRFNNFYGTLGFGQLAGLTPTLSIVNGRIRFSDPPTTYNNPGGPLDLSDSEKKEFLISSLNYYLDQTDNTAYIPDGSGSWVAL
jgi:hypothetical protein